MNFLRHYLLAVQFFTRIPVTGKLAQWVGYSPAMLRASAAHFPGVGWLVGAMVAGASALLFMSLPPSAYVPLVVAVLGTAAGVWLTGAFHEDGLSDFVDGMGGGYTREKILAIMKDSHVGAYGVIAIVLALLLKYQALLALSGSHSLAYVFAALIAAHAISRLMAVSIIMTQQYVRDDDTARAKLVAQGLSKASFAIAVLTGGASVALLFVAGIAWASIVSALAIALLLRIYLGWQMQKKLGGYTGDCLGAVQQITEIGFYLGLLLSW